MIEMGVTYVGRIEALEAVGSRVEDVEVGNGPWARYLSAAVC
jgi:hypothetical protein